MQTGAQVQHSYSPTLCKNLLQVTSGQSEQQNAPLNKFIGSLDPHCSLQLLVSSGELAKGLLYTKIFTEHKEPTARVHLTINLLSNVPCQLDCPEDGIFTYTASYLKL
jgi:hypothetical protein